MNLQNLDFTPLWITMKTGVAATFVSFFLGIFAARFGIVPAGIKNRSSL